MMYVSQLIMLYALNLYSAVSQLYLHNAGKKRKILCTFKIFINKWMWKKSQGYYADN